MQGNNRYFAVIYRDITDNYDKYNIGMYFHSEWVLDLHFRLSFMTNLTSETETKSPEWWESRPGLRLPGPGIRFSPRVRSRSREWDQNRDRTRVTETEEEEGHTHSWSDAGPEQTRGHVQHHRHHRHARPALHGWELIIKMLSIYRPRPTRNFFRT